MWRKRRQNPSDISINTDGLSCNLLRRISLPVIDAGINGLGILRCYPPERIFDDPRGVRTYPQLQEQNMQILIAADELLIIVGPVVAWPGALPETVIALGVKQPFFVKTGKLKLMIHIGGEDKIIFLFDQFQQIGIGLAHTDVIAVYQDVTRPPCPIFLQSAVRIEAPGVHIPDAVFLMKVRKIFHEPLAAVRHSGRGGHSCSCADQDGIGGFYLSLQPICLLRVIVGKC